MGTDFKRFTPYAEVDTVLLQLHSGVKTLFGEVFCGMYIHGSLALGDFTLKSSDIDFLILITRELSEIEIAGLRGLHSQLLLVEPNWAKKLEGSYVTLDQLKEPNPPKEPRPYVNCGTLSISQYGWEWVLEKHVLLEHGIHLEGPELKTIIDPVHTEQIIKATLLLFREWWEPMLDDPTTLITAEYQAYAILTMCRILYTIRFSEIVSKPVAANWMKLEFDGLWKPIIEEAQNWQHGMSLKLLDEVIAMIKFTQKYCRLDRRIIY